MNIKTLVTNAILAALYIAVSALVQPFGFSQIQFRISEMFNHLVVFNKNYAYGIVVGVFITNLLFSPMVAYDLIFGVGHSILSLTITIICCRYVKNLWMRMTINTLVFTIMMWLIALELNLALGFPFMFTWLTTAAGELVVLAVGIPVMIALNKRVKFDQLLNN